MMTSPAFRPIFAAGLSAATSATSAPSPGFSPNCLAKASVSG